MIYATILIVLMSLNTDYGSFLQDEKSILWEYTQGNIVIGDLV